MTLPRRAHLYTYDLEGAQTGVLAEFIDFAHDVRLDTSEELSFITPGDHPHNDLIVEDCEVRWKGKRFYAKAPVIERDGGSVVMKVTCPALWYRLTDAQIVGETMLDDVTAEVGAQALLDAAVGSVDGWTIAPDPIAHTATFSYAATDMSLLAALRAWAGVTATHLRFDTESKTIAFQHESGLERGVGFRYGRNVLSVKRTAKAPDFTRLYAYGADGLTLSGIVGTDYIQDLSWYTDLGVPLATAQEKYIKVRRFADDSIVDEDTLYSRAVPLLEQGSQGTLAYEMTVADLSEFIGVVERFVPGDQVRVADTPLGVDVRTTLTRYLDKPLRPSQSKVELSYLTPAASTIPQGSTVGGENKTWLLFGKNNGGFYALRSDQTATLNRIGLRFRSGGEAMFWHELRFTGVDAGSLAVSAVDADTGELLHAVQNISYTNGQVIHLNLLSAWLQEGLEGDKDYRIRVKTTATGGAAANKGVDIAVGDSKFFILAYGAVRQTVTLPNSQLFTYTGAVQNFTVPDGISEIRITAKGSKGSNADWTGGGGDGGEVVATFPVVAGSILDVYVGGVLWPNGGLYGSAGGNNGGSGGGSSHVVATGGAFASAMIVAAGGGGAAEGSASDQTPEGGFGGFYSGGPGASNPIGGASQTAGGTPTTAGSPGTFGQGGAGQNTGNFFDFGSGGGGGGWYGGAGGKIGPGGNGQGGGGGGSGWLDSTATDFEFNDGANAGTGTVLIEWGVPVES